MLEIKVRLMGLNQNNGTGNADILVVKRGAICRESDHEIEGYENVSGEVDGRPYSKWIQKFPSLDGMITGISWYDTEDQYSTQFQGIKIDVEDGDEKYILDLAYGTRPYDNFTRFAENIDFTKPIEFIARTEKGTDSIVFFAMQDGEVVRQKYTKNNLGECPPAVQNKTTKKWNFDDQREWLLENLLTKVVPNIPHPKAAAAGDSWTN